MVAARGELKMAVLGNRCGKAKMKSQHLPNDRTLYRSQRPGEHV